MYEILKRIINNLNSNQLEEIFSINKLTLQGFRIKGPSNTAKTQRMKTLLINNPKLESILKKTADFYSTQKNKDYSWALVSTIDTNLIQKKIDDSNLGEVAYALINANKLILLKELLLSDNGKASTGKNESVNNEGKESSNNESIVYDLRKIIKDLEEKNKNLNESVKLLRNEVANLNQENDNLKTRNKENKDENKNLHDKYNQLKELLDITEDKYKKGKENIVILEQEIKNAKLEIEKLNKMHIMFYGNDVYRRLLETKVSSLEDLIYEYANCLEQIRDYKIYQKLVILSFTLNKAEIEELCEKEIFNYFEEMYNVVIIHSLEQLDEYIAKVGRYNE